MKNRLRLALLLLLVGLLMPLSLSVSAHPWTDMFWWQFVGRSLRFNTSGNARPTYWLTKSVNDQPTAWRLRIIDAATAWNSIGQSMQFTYAGDFTFDMGWEDALDGNCPSFGPGTPNNHSAFHVDELDAYGFSAMTALCLQSSNSSTIITFQIIIDPDIPWYTGTESPIPAGSVDLLATLTHCLGTRLVGVVTITVVMRQAYARNMMLIGQPCAQSSPLAEYVKEPSKNTTFTPSRMPIPTLDHLVAVSVQYRSHVGKILSAVWPPQRVAEFAFFDDTQSRRGELEIGLERFALGKDSLEKSVRVAIKEHEARIRTLERAGRGMASEARFYPVRRYSELDQSQLYRLTLNRPKSRSDRWADTSLSS